MILIVFIRLEIVAQQNNIKDQFKQIWLTLRSSWSSCKCWGSSSSVKRNFPTDVCQKSSNISSGPGSTGWSFSPTRVGRATCAVAVATVHNYRLGYSWIAFWINEKYPLSIHTWGRLDKMKETKDLWNCHLNIAKSTTFNVIQCI